MLAVMMKELRTYFLTPLGYIFMGFFLLISGIFFALGNLFPMSSNYNSLLSTITFIFMIVVPILTMRLISEESRQKTDQLLLTSPLKVFEMVIGKYLAAVIVFLATILITVIYPIIMNFHGIISISEIIGGYIGFFLLGSSFIAIGLFISALTDNQVSAAVISFSALLFIWLLEALPQVLPNNTLSGVIFVALILAGLTFLVRNATKNWFVTIATGLGGMLIISIFFAINASWYDGIILKFFDWFSLLKRYDSFTSGLLSVSSIIYYISFISAFIFLTIQMIEKRRWN
jgi:ABC-2 type transport system permease protein